MPTHDRREKKKKKKGPSRRKNGPDGEHVTPEKGGKNRETGEKTSARGQVFRKHVQRKEKREAGALVYGPSLAEDGGMVSGSIWNGDPGDPSPKTQRRKNAEKAYYGEAERKKTRSAKKHGRTPLGQKKKEGVGRETSNWHLRQ